MALNVQQHPKNHLGGATIESQTPGGVRSGQSPLLRTSSGPPSMGPAAVHVSQACVEKEVSHLGLL